MRQSDKLELWWAAFWILIAAMVATLIIGCASGAPSGAGVQIAKGARVETVNAPTTNTVDHDMSETQRAAQVDMALVVIRAAVGGFMVGLALPELSGPWWVRLACGAIGVAMIGFPFIRL